MASVVMSEVDKFSVKGQDKIIEGDGAHFVPSRKNKTMSETKFLDANGEEVSVGDKLRHKELGDIVQVIEINSEAKYLRVKRVSGSFWPWNPDTRRSPGWLGSLWILAKKPAQNEWVPRDKNGVELKIGDVVKSAHPIATYLIDSIDFKNKLIGSHAIVDYKGYPATQSPNTYKSRPEEISIKVEEDGMKKNEKWTDHARKIVEKKKAAEIPNAIVDAKKSAVEEKLSDNHFARQADDILKDIKEYLDDLNGADALIEARRIKDELRNANLAALQKKQTEVHAYLQKHLPKDEVVAGHTKTLNKWGYMVIGATILMIAGAIGSSIYLLV